MCGESSGAQQLIISAILYVHSCIKGNRTRYSIVKIFCFLKGKKTKANGRGVGEAFKNHICCRNKACSTFHSFIFSKREVLVVWFFSMCLQSYPKVPLESKMQLLSQEEFAPLYLNALIRTRDYHITSFYHSTGSGPMFFHGNALFVCGSICGKLTPHCLSLTERLSVTSQCRHPQWPPILPTQQTSPNPIIRESWSAPMPSKLPSPGSLSPSATLCWENKRSDVIYGLPFPTPWP